MKTPTAKPSACKMENIAFIPATPGFFIIEPWFDEDDDKKIVEVSLMPIIGWHIKAGCTYPITPFQIEDDGYKCSAILTPEKTVFGHCQDPPLQQPSRMDNGQK